ncbi:hypothetical protein D3C86_1948870 [compost metagenome]
MVIGFYSKQDPADGLDHVFKNDVVVDTGIIGIQRMSYFLFNKSFAIDGFFSNEISYRSIFKNIRI